MSSEDYSKIPFTPVEQASSFSPIKYLPSGISNGDESPEKCQKNEALTSKCSKCRISQKDEMLEKTSSPSKIVAKKSSLNLSANAVCLAEKVSNSNNNHLCGCAFKPLHNCPSQQDKQTLQHPIISFKKSLIQEQQPLSQNNFHSAYQQQNTSPLQQIASIQQQSAYPQQNTSPLQQIVSIQQQAANIKISEPHFYPQNTTSSQQLTEQPLLPPSQADQPMDRPNTPVTNSCLSLQQEVVNEICTRTWNYAYEMLLKQMFCDVLLISQQGTVKAHSAILAFHSPYLKNSLENRGNQSLALNLQTVPIDTVRQLVNFLYTGELNVTKFNLVNLLNISEQYNFHSLQQVCLQFFKEVNPENVIYFLFLTNSSSLYNMKGSLLDYIIHNFLDVCETTDFMFLPIEQLEYILKSDDLSINCELEAFKSVVKWISFKKEERLQHSRQLLDGPVRLELMSVDELTYQVESHHWLFCSSATRHLLSEAYRKKLMMKSGLCLNEIRYRNSKT